jgi:peptide deformylase
MLPTKLKIRYYGDPVLRRKSKLVKDIGPSERMLAQAMVATMHHYKGIGLAAPQVGINQRIIVIDVGDGPFAVINPYIVKKTGSASVEEGCLSLPEVTVKVKRPLKIWVSFLNERGERVEKVLENLLARVFLHETDHLNGKLIIDYASLAQHIKMKDQLKFIRQLAKEGKEYVYPPQPERERHDSAH